MNQVAKDQSPSGLSIAALVTGILQLGIVPIILGIIDLNKIKSGEASPNGKGFDIAGIVLGGISLLWIVVVIIFVIIFGSIWSGFFLM